MGSIQPSFLPVQGVAQNLSDMKSATYEIGAARRSPASLRSRSRAEITVLMCQLQSLHNKAAKIILDLPIGSSASEALNKLNWKTLARRRAEHRATFIYKCLNNLFSHRFNIEFNKDKHDYNTRCKNNIRKSASNRNWGHWTSTNFASNDWNKLDLSIRQSPSLASFKRVLRNVNSF